MNDFDDWVQHTASFIEQSRALIEQGRSRLEEDARWLQFLGVDTQSLKDQIANRISDADRMYFETLQGADSGFAAKPARALRRKVLRPLV